MKEVLILGASPVDSERSALYDFMEHACRVDGYVERVNTPVHTQHFEGTDKESYDRGFQLVRSADLIFAEMTFPSTGMGMELREAELLNKPVYIVANKGSEVSGLVASCPVVQGIKFYDSSNQLHAHIRHTIFKRVGRTAA